MTKKDPHVVKQLAKNPTFEIGDVVRLVSGGPSMAVRGVNGDDIFCEWFDKAAPRCHTFLKAQLSHTNPEQLPILNIQQLGSSEDRPPWEYMDKKDIE